MFTKNDQLNKIAEAYKKQKSKTMEFVDEVFGQVYTIAAEDANEFITKAAAAKKAGETTFKLNGKEYPVTIKIDPDKVLEAERMLKKGKDNTADVIINPTDDDLRESDGESVLNEADRVSKALKDIKKEYKKLKKQFSRKGSYENFGEKEGRKLRDKYDFNPYGSPEDRKIAKMIQDFEAWAMDYDGSPSRYDAMFESVVNEMNDMEMVADQLVNNVEDGMMSKNEFADLLSQETKFDKKSLGKIYDEYLDLDPRTRMKMLKTRDMMKFLKDQGLKEEVLTEGKYDAMLYR